MNDRGGRARLQAELDALRKALDRKPAEFEIDDLRPVIAPASFFEGSAWPGPFTRLGSSPFGLTWAVLQPAQTMIYVTPALQAHWEAEGFDWRARALHNLARELSPTWTHELNRAEGDIYAVAMMHLDGVGPSRLLLRQPLQELFPDGYRFAVPEMSCAFAFSTHLDPSEQTRVAGLIGSCYREGARPVAAGAFEPEILGYPTG